MTEVSEGQIQTTALDHHGLVAAICQDLKIAQRIDDRLPYDSQRKVSPGRAVVAMILNGLGFTNRRLYLTNQFFESKAIERPLGPDLNAKDITDYTLGHALDNIAEYGSSRLFAEVAFGIAVDNHLLEDKNHLDTTSILVHGAYEVNDDPKTIEVVRGFSKDHRPDLKQIVLKASCKIKTIDCSCDAKNADMIPTRELPVEVLPLIKKDQKKQVLLFRVSASLSTISSLMM